MTNLKPTIDSHPILVFLVFTFLISSISFVFISTIEGAESPENLHGFFIWMIAIWSPSISALTLFSYQKRIKQQLKSAFRLPSFNWWLVISISPLIIVFIIVLHSQFKGLEFDLSSLNPFNLFSMITINLLMGPLGEEFGWRGFLYPILKDKLGWLGSGLLVGFIWAIWHAPLWWVNSPQSEIPYWAFSIIVICLSLLMAMIYNHSNGSLIAIILLHLMFNVSLNIIMLIGFKNLGGYVIESLYYFMPFTILLIALHELYSDKVCKNI